MIKRTYIIKNELGKEFTMIFPVLTDKYEQKNGIFQVYRGLKWPLFFYIKTSVIEIISRFTRIRIDKKRN